MHRALEHGTRVVAFGLLASLLGKAWLDVSLGWDVWFYHLPFAARLVRLVGSDQYVFDAVNQARFEGFPLLGELVQGWLWKLSDRPESANLLAFASVPLFAWFVRARLDVPVHRTLVALLAVPLVQVHATSAYVDLPGNAAMAALVLLAAQGFVSPLSLRALALACGLGAFAANTKTLMQPLVLAALAVMLVSLLRARRWGATTLVGAAGPLVFFTALKNLLLRGNPFFPLHTRVLGLALPGPEEPYQSTPVWLEHAWRPVRFACSVLEVGVRPLGDPQRWTLDQWTPPSAPGFRMGGYFGAYMAAALVFVAWRGWAHRRERPVRAMMACFVALTALVSVLPQSHELRYYVGWAMVLVVLALWLAQRGGVETPAVVGAIAALAVVLWVTRATYTYPSGISFDALKRTVDTSGVQDGDRVCVGRPPWTFLWVARFHPPKKYVVQEADEVDDCASVRRL